MIKPRVVSRNTVVRRPGEFASQDVRLKDDDDAKEECGGCIPEKKVNIVEKFACMSFRGKEP